MDYDVILNKREWKNLLLRPECADLRKYLERRVEEKYSISFHTERLTDGRYVTVESVNSSDYLTKYYVLSGCKFKRKELLPFLKENPPIGIFKITISFALMLLAIYLSVHGFFAGATSTLHMTVWGSFLLSQIFMYVYLSPRSLFSLFVSNVLANIFGKDVLGLHSLRELLMQINTNMTKEEIDGK